MPTHTDLASRAERVAVACLAASAALSPVALGIQETVVVSAMAAWIVAQFARRQLAPATAATIPLFLWLAAGALSLIHTVDMHASLRGLQKMVKAMLIVFMTADLMRSPHRVRTLLMAMLLGATVVSVDAFAQALRGTDLLAHMPAGGAPGGVHRLTAMYDHANGLATYVISVLPVCIAVALGWPATRIRWWAWSLVVTLGAALVLTFSRSGAFACAISVIVFCVLRRAWKTLAVMSVLAVIGWMLLPAPIHAWVAEQPSWIHVLAQPLRLEIWQAALNMIHAHPVFGVGVNTFVLNYASYRLPGDTLQGPYYAHNQYLHMAAEIGFVGFGVFCLFLARTFSVWQRMLRSADAWGQLAAAGLGCGIVAFLAIGLLESALYSSRSNLFLWLWLGLLYGMAGNASASTVSPSAVASLPGREHPPVTPPRSVGAPSP